MAAVLAAVLILTSELTTGAVAERVGPYGYLALLAAGWLGLAAHADRSAWSGRLSWALLVVLVFNAAFFLALELGLLGPAFELMVVDLVVLFFSGVAGGVGVIGAAALATFGRPGPPGAIRLVAGLVGLGVLVTVAHVTGLIDLSTLLPGRARPFLFR